MYLLDEYIVYEEKNKTNIINVHRRNNTRNKERNNTNLTQNDNVRARDLE